MTKKQLKKITDFMWEIPSNTRQDMVVPCHVYVTRAMLESLLKDRSLEQLMNVATLPGIQKAAIVMPDAHEGYGFPIGGIAATKWPDGVISPGGIGYDINCGVRLLKTSQSYEQIKNKLEDLSKELYKQVPSGVGKGGFLQLKSKEIDKVLKTGSGWAVKNGYGEEKDLEYTESNGKLDNADPRAVSKQAKKRGAGQLGTLGGGNHFVEVDKVSNIFDKRTASVYGLTKNQVVIMLHTGSRGLGHQVATDYIKTLIPEMANHGIKLPDRELACVPLHSIEGTHYFDAMAAAANFAWCNRQIITWEIRKAWENTFGKSGGKLDVLYDVAHNIAKVETHNIGKGPEKMIVHRKGATRAFGPGNNEIPDEYMGVGQPVLIPGSMGTSSYVLAGTNKSMELTFGSTCHGAGRRLSRRAAKKQVQGDLLRESLRKEGIIIQAGSLRGLAEEAPIAYKDVDDVVETVHQAGLAFKVAKLRPVAVIKG